jgi:hypothetical protein
MLAHPGGRVGSADGMTRVNLCGRKFIGRHGQRAQTTADKQIKSSADSAIAGKTIAAPAAVLFGTIHT